MGLEESGASPTEKDVVSSLFSGAAVPGLTSIYRRFPG
jgi:hypothetical protein